MRQLPFVTAFRNMFAGDAATLAAWESTRRLQSAPKLAKKPEPPKLAELPK
jgi:hypothetical protein